MAELFAAVAGERTGIATEPPVDIDERAAQFASTVDGSVVAAAEGQIVGMLHIETSRHGFGELGMLVDRDWRGRGVGSALVEAAISLARGRGLHKLCLEVFAHNTAGIALYRKYGFVEEGHRDSIPPVLAATSPDLAVVRMHGHSDKWDSKDIHERFGYRYTEAELTQWAPKVRDLAQDAAGTHVLFNNCYRDYAQVNAQHLAELLRS